MGAISAIGYPRSTIASSETDMLVATPDSGALADQHLHDCAGQRRKDSAVRGAVDFGEGKRRCGPEQVTFVGRVDLNRLTVDARGVHRRFTIVRDLPVAYPGFPL